jgi:molybdate transport system substrate-binding protein
MFNRVSRRKVAVKAHVLLAILASGLALASQVHAQEVRVVAAADLQFAMADLALHFEKRTGIKVNVTYGSSGNSFAQIENGAPYDVFFSADVKYPRELESSGRAEPGSLFVYGAGHLVIWVSAESKIDLAREGWNALLDERVQKIAIANPEHAPYGRAAISALTKAGLYEKVKKKLVYGENISQAAQFVQSGNAQAGILAKSLVLSPAMRGGKSWSIPLDSYAPIRQAAILLKSAPSKAQAKSFLDFVKSPHGRFILGAYGFDPVAPEDMGASAK